MAGYQGFPAGDARIQQLLKMVFGIIGKGSPPPAETPPYAIPQFKPAIHPKSPAYGMGEPMGVTTRAFGGGGGDKQQAIAQRMDAYRPGVGAKKPTMGMGGTLPGPKMEPLASEGKASWQLDEQKAREAQLGSSLAGVGNIAANVRNAMTSSAASGRYDPVLRQYTSEPGREPYGIGSPEEERARGIYEAGLPAKTGALAEKEIASKERIAEIEARGGISREQLRGLSEKDKALITALGGGALPDMPTLRAIIEAGGVEPYLRKKKKKEGGGRGTWEYGEPGSRTWGSETYTPGSSEP